MGTVLCGIIVTWWRCCGKQFEGKCWNQSESMVNLPNLITWNTLISFLKALNPCPYPNLSIQKGMTLHRDQIVWDLEKYDEGRKMTKEKCIKNEWMSIVQHSPSLHQLTWYLPFSPQLQNPELIQGLAWTATRQSNEVWWPGLNWEESWQPFSGS